MPFFALLSGLDGGDDVGDVTKSTDEPAGNIGVNECAVQNIRSELIYEPGQTIKYPNIPWPTGAKAMGGDAVFA